MTELMHPLDARTGTKVMAAIGMSGGGLVFAVGGSEICPIDIRPEVFAANGAVGGPFDGRAAFGGHTLDAVPPLADHHLLYQKRTRQLGAGAVRLGFEICV